MSQKSYASKTPVLKLDPWDLCEEVPQKKVGKEVRYLQYKYIVKLQHVWKGVLWERCKQSVEGT